MPKKEKNKTTATTTAPPAAEVVTTPPPADAGDLDNDKNIGESVPISTVRKILKLTAAYAANSEQTGKKLGEFLQAHDVPARMLDDTLKMYGVEGDATPALTREAIATHGMMGDADAIINVIDERIA